MKSPAPRAVAILAFLGALGLGLWLWLGPWAQGEWSDGQRSVAADAALRVATWGEPAPAFSGPPPQVDGRTALAPDGRWLVWAGKDAGGAHDLFASELRDGRLRSSAPLSALCTVADECAPAFGGEWLYFSSDRPGGIGGHDLWRAHFADGAASAPELVPGPANTAGEELDPAPDANGETLTFVSARDGAGWDLYSAPLGAGSTTRLAALCSAQDEREPAFTQADRALVFSSSRPGGQGGFDLYRAARFGAQYTAAQPLTPLNTAQDERAPGAARDDLSLSFVRTEAGANPVLLSSPAVELFRSPRRAITWSEWLALAGLLALALLALLVQRFPELDRIYKCLLLSVLVHLLLLWWFHEIWLPSGKSEPDPSRAPLHVRLEARVPEIVPERIAVPPPASERALAASPPTPAARVPVAAELNAESQSATPSAPALALALPQAPSEPAPEATRAPAPRLDSHVPTSAPQPNSASVATAARERDPLHRREPSELEPRPSVPPALPVAEERTAAHSASPAAALALDSLASGAPSATSRPMGRPSRPAQQHSRGSPAASPRSGSVAQAASLAAPEARPSSSAAEASPAAHAAAAQVLQLRDSLNTSARAAAPMSTLELDELAAGAPSNEGVGRPGEAPQRADLSAARAVISASAAPSRPSVARRSDEFVQPSTSALPKTEFTPGTESRSTSIDVTALAPAAGQDVALRAVEAPSMGLDSFEPSSASPSATADVVDQGPRHAPSAGTMPRQAAPSASLGASLASRAEAPEPGLPRASTALDGRAHQGSERNVVLAEPAESVARPAESAGTDAGAGWLPDLAAPSSDRAASSAPSSAGPERAETARSSATAAAPLAGNAPSLARAPQPASEAQPRPAKSDWDSTPYQNRSGAEKARALKLYGGSERTEAAVARGLEYLASIQRPNGAWGDLEAQDEKYGRIAIGKTALCTLAFLGAGHTPDSATEHSAVVARALEFLLSVQDPQSGHFGDASAYDHGIASYAIGECFALTHDARLRSALERAIAHVLAMQSRRDDDRLRGGWGYYFADGTLYDPWSRTSITAWQVMALESARLSGLAVPDSAFEAARSFLDHAADEQLGAYRYNHDPERLNSAYPTLPASTPAALFALALLGEDINDEQHRAAREYVLDRAPDGYRYSGEADFVHLGRGNPYFWYYGTLATFRLGGQAWQRWNAALQESLLPAQARDGSWQPLDVYARYARDNPGDKSYTTSLCVLSLEVYYRYYLPLLKVR